jgi:hypothetical protein
MGWKAEGVLLVKKTTGDLSLWLKRPRRESDVTLN